MAGFDSGIKLTEDAIEHCERFVKSVNLSGSRSEWIIFKIQEMKNKRGKVVSEVVVEHVGPPLSTFEDMKAKIDPDAARYIVMYVPCELDGQKKEKITLITYTGPGAKMKEKMRYSSTEKVIYNKLNGDSSAYILKLDSYDALALEKITAAILQPM